MTVQIPSKKLFTARTLDQVTYLTEEPTTDEVVKASGYKG